MTVQRDWLEKDYYKVLGVTEDASPKDITRAYRKLARELHPDRNGGDAASEERFKEVSAAYDVIGDADKRKEYDEVRRMGPLGGFGPGGPAGDGPFVSGDFTDLGDLLGGLFGNARGPGPASGRAGPRAGADLETELHLSFVDAVRGVTTTVRLTSDAPCSTCSGTGAAPGTSPIRCENCGGRGVVSDNQGLFGFSQPCPVCGGRGVRIETPCPTCHGSGVERRPREVRVRIPPGVTDGQRIRLKGRGAPGVRGGPPGDLYVICRVAPHEVFGRNGRDLTITMPISFPEAALGTRLTVPTLLGDPVTIKVPAGTPTGKVFRIRGKGVETPKGAGDLLVTVEVAVPETLTDEARQALEAYAAAASEGPRAHSGV